MISIIVLVDENRAIGYKGDQLIYIEDDLKRFKMLTLNKTIVMGRKTFEALPSGPLSNRHNVILTTNLDYNCNCNNCEVLHSVEEVISKYKDFIVIGGAKIYEIFLPYTQVIYLTTVHKKFKKVDTYFPRIAKCKYKTLEHIYNMYDNENDVYYSYELLIK